MKIVVRGTNWIGDAVMSTPAIRQLRRLFPAASISLLTRPWAKDIFSDSGLFDEIIAPDRAGSGLKETLRHASELKQRDFDLAVLLPNSFASAFSARLAGIRHRIGYSSDGRGFLLTDAVHVPDWKNKRHEVFYYLNLINELEHRLIGTNTTDQADTEPVIGVSDKRKLNAMQLLAANGVDASRTTVAIAAGSTNSMAKRWLPEYFARVNDMLQHELRANVILIGSKDEADVSQAVASFAEKKPVDLTGKTDLSEAAAVLSEIDLLISNDMGLAHLAPAVGTATVAIFGPTDHVTTRPFSHRAEVVRAGVECSPCMLRQCPIDHRCMTRVTPESVFDTALAKLGI